MFKKKKEVEIYGTDIHSLPVFSEPTTVTLVGNKGQGKTTIARWLVYKLYCRFMREGLEKILFLAVCGTPKLALSWGWMLGKCHGHVLDIEPLDNIARYMDEKIEGVMCEWMDDNPELDPEEFSVPSDCFSVSIMDDCGRETSFKNQPIIKRVSSESRHIGMFHYSLIQNLTQMSTGLRNGTDILLLLESANEQQLKLIYSTFLGNVNISFKAFKFLTSKFTNGIGNGIVIYKRAKSNRVQDRIFWYSHDIRNKPQKICPYQHEFARRHYVSSANRRRAVKCKEDYADYDITDEQEDMYSDINENEPHMLSRYVNETYEDKDIKVHKMPSIQEKEKYD